MKSPTAANRNILVMDSGDHGASVVLEELALDSSILCLEHKQLNSDDTVDIQPQDRVVITSENVLDSVLKHMNDPKRFDVVTTLKNKFKCREILTSIYPDFYFRLLELKDLHNLKLPEGREFIIKPNKGYFATAIKMVNSKTDLAEIKAEIIDEVKQNSEIFPDSVLSNSQVIVEEYIEGEEYAVDMYYNSAGKAEIINIYHHPIPSNKDYLHVLYYTSKDIFDRLHQPLLTWFESLNKELKINAFPIHAEFRLRDNQLVPVELNPMRFGGDGLVDLAYHAFGFNPFKAYFEDMHLDWDTLWEEREDKLYAWVMGYNGTDIDLKTHRPDIRQFQNLFKKIFSDTLLNYKQHLGFSVVYVEETEPAAILRLVETDFKEFFLKSNTFTEVAFSKLYQSGVQIRIVENSTVWEKNSIGDYALLVIEGTLEVLGESTNGENFLLDTIGPKSVVGEFAALDGSPRSAGVRSGAKGCTVIRITGPAFRKLLRESPGLFEDLYWQQQQRIRRLNDQVSELKLKLLNN